MYETQNLLRQLGIHGTYKGYHYLLNTLKLAIENEKHLPLYSKMIFPTVARTFKTTPARVERDIRTMIIRCWNCPGKEKLLEIAPFELYGPPTTSEFIDILYWHLKFLSVSSTI